MSADSITKNNFKKFYEKILPYLNGGGSGEEMTAEDLEDVKNNFSLLERDIPTAMDANDLAEVKNAFNIS